MRITNSMTTNRLLMNVNRNATALDRLFMQLSSGKVIQNPSENPIIASRALRFRTNVSEVQQFQRNNNQAISWMEVSEQNLHNMTNVLTRTRSELMVQAASSTYTFQNRQTIAREIELLFAQINTEMNGTFAGRYLFSGFRTDRPPIITQNNLSTAPGVTPVNVVDLEITKTIHRNDFRDVEAVFWRDPADPNHLEVVVTYDWLNRPDRETAGWESDPNVTVHVVGAPLTEGGPGFPHGINILRLPYQARYDANGNLVRDIELPPTIVGLPVNEVSLHDAPNPYIPQAGTITFIRETGELVVHSDDITRFEIHPGSPAQPSVPPSSATLTHTFPARVSTTPPGELNISVPFFPVTGAAQQIIVTVDGSPHTISLPVGTTQAGAIGLINGLPTDIVASATGGQGIVLTAPAGAGRTLGLTTGTAHGPSINGQNAGAGGESARAAVFPLGLTFGPDGLVGEPGTFFGVTDVVVNEIGRGGFEIAVGMSFDEALAHLQSQFAAYADFEIFDDGGTIAFRTITPPDTDVAHTISILHLPTPDTAFGDAATAGTPVDTHAYLPITITAAQLAAGDVSLIVARDGMPPYPITIPQNTSLDDARTLLSNIPGVGLQTGTPATTFTFYTETPGTGGSIAINRFPGVTVAQTTPGSDYVPAVDEVPPGYGGYGLTYRIDGLFQGELNPKIFFETTDHTTGIHFSQANQEIMFEVGTNVSLAINTQAREVYPWQLFSDMHHLLQWVNGVHISESPPATEAQQAYERAFFSEMLHSKFSNIMARVDGHMQTVTTEFTALGSRMERMEMISVRLDENEDTFRMLRDQNENIDYLEIIMRLNAVEAVFQAAMQVGARISQLSLVNFI
ncbi:MAG: hypothetical protein FWB74_01475 [Defluviitaleaceae bacterium]|nr:hypothetical protein [Defluviitaleaceae bacterium]